MKQDNFNCRITANISTQKAIEGISNVKGWWATNVSGNAKDMNDSFTVRFGKTFSIMKVSEVIPNKKIVWFVVDCDLPLFANRTEWKHTEIVWEVSGTGNTTEISMTHVGLTPDLGCYSDCEKGWRFYVQESLFRLLSENKGFPGTGIFANIFCDSRKYEGLIYFKNDPLPEYPAGFFFIDVKETNGEQVTGVHAAAEYKKENFRAAQLKGEYFMIIENKPVFDNIYPLDDILKMISYHCTLLVDKTPQEVFEKICRVSEWWTENFEGSCQNPGDVWTVRFGETFVTVKVVEHLPHKKIVWKVIDCYLHWLQDKKEWNNTKLIWRISTVNHSVQIDFTHIGLVPEIECYGNCVKGWDQYVKGSLQKLLMEGKGLPGGKKN